jgi:hypothetical protein
MADIQTPPILVDTPSKPAPPVDTPSKPAPPVDTPTIAPLVDPPPSEVVEQTAEPTKDGEKKLDFSNNSDFTPLGDGDGEKKLDFSNNSDFTPLDDGDGEKKLDFSNNSDFMLLNPGDADAPNIEPIIQGAVKGVTEGTAILSGVAAGARWGFLSTLSIPFPGARVLGTTIGGLIGGGLSMYAAHTALNQLEKVKLPSGAPLTFSDVNDVPPKDRVAFAFGETAGNGAAFVSGTVILAKVGFRVLSKSYPGRVINGILENAAKSTKIFVSKESIAVVGAGTGGALAEAVDPGDKLTRFGLEVTGGVVASGRIIISTGVFLRDLTMKFVKILSPAAQRSEAARIIQMAFKESGDDIVLTSKLIDESIKSELKTPATVAQTVANDATIALETSVRKLSSSADVEINDSAEATYSVLRKMIELLRGTGEPSALRAAATLQARYFFTLLSERANIAKQLAVDAAAKIPLTNINRAALSLQAFDAADTALKQARAVETIMWDAVPSDLAGDAKNILQGFTDIKASMLARTPVPKLVQDTINDILDGTQAITVGFLKKFRSQMLKSARAATNQADNASDARFYAHLAEAALDDIDTIFKGPGTGVLRTVGVAVDAYDTARRYTAALHDAFTNSYTGKSLATGRTGLKLAPEGLLGRAFAGGREVTAYRLVELEESVRFLPKQGLGGQEALDSVGLMFQAQERFFAILATDTGGSGLQKVKSIQDFLKKNPQLAERFSEMTKFLESIAKTEKGATAAIEALANGTKAIEKRAAFSRFANTASDTKFESPVDSMKALFLGSSPAQKLVSLARLASKKGGEVVAGFKATVYDHAIREATRGDGSMDFVKLRKVLFDPISAGKASAVEIMIENGALSSADVKQLKTVLDAADQVLKSQTRIVGGTQIEEEVTGLLNLVIRAHGAKTAGSVLGGGSGSQLIIAAGGAKLSEQVIARTPNAKVAKIISEAMNNRELFLALTRKAVSDVEKFSAALALNSILVRLGMRPITPLGTATLGVGGDLAEDDEPINPPPTPQPTGVTPDILH